ncbi:P-loop containing nucleoside triphosphate hydrolase protein [Microthyrium microscopicum]|uniref:P-loop containing nucleoside triphosphate hydrolase protein n=1 Tax=Microthyrium microscopicum TaxID=703497 RepID=A0A6A6TX44_9PEZI|nr:P-loop containing nucleoside triphosphate hydrolase protein [Microthyrium microscopicum]
MPRSGLLKGWMDAQDNASDTESTSVISRDETAFKIGVERLEKYLAVQRDAAAQSWLSRPEVPSSNEVMDISEPWENVPSGESVPIEPNRPAGPFDSREDYLKTHYTLLREEAVNPLREGAVAIRHRHEANEDIFETDDMRNLGVYTHVHVRGLTLTNQGVAVEVSFSTKSCQKKIQWAMSSRLCTGSMVALSLDHFQKHCIVATVAARDIEKLIESPPRIDLYFANAMDLEIDPTLEFTMIEERTAFLEAQRHTMLAFQRLMNEPFPLADMIVDCDMSANDNTPQHILDRPQANLSTVFGRDYENHDLRDLPPPEQCTLDKSQHEALQHVLTKPLAIIQGPPGTGKTHISVEALKILLDRVDLARDPPIVIACQTNHALDQILRKVAEFEPNNFARVGGRSKDRGFIEPRTMKKLRETMSDKKWDPENARRRTAKDIVHLREDFGKLLVPFSEGLQAVHFQIAQIIGKEHVQALEEGDKKWSGSTSKLRGDQIHDNILEWVGKHLARVDPPDFADDAVYEGDEEVFEPEAIREREAEAAGGDDDVDKLKGTYIPLMQEWRGVERGAPMDDEKARALLRKKSIWDVPTNTRGALFNWMLKSLKETIRDWTRRQAARYIAKCVQFKKLNHKKDLCILFDQKLIGMTTTGLSKYRALVDAIAPRIVMIEEAAESLEAPVVSGCVPSLQQLILVGDHLQLKPSLVNKWLEGSEFYLDISLFERMVNNEIDYKILRTQRRMIPEIRENLFPIYGDKIQDHVDVTKRKPINGMSYNSWIWSHRYMEAKDEMKSSYNPSEADMIVGFCIYLIQNGYQNERITILTFYNAQRKIIHKKLTEAINNLLHDGKTNFQPSETPFKIVTVDSYQGEENDIVILSLVRSNDFSSIGFAGSDNRICVALSRARNGFYIFGNMDCFVSQSETWNSVYEIMAEKGHIGHEEFPIYCSAHNEQTIIKHDADWAKVNGGCRRHCEAVLECGHRCPAKCHSTSHAGVRCAAPCELKLKQCGHECTKKCGQRCMCAYCIPPKEVVEKQVEQPERQGYVPMQEAYPHRPKAPITQADHSPTPPPHRRGSQAAKHRTESPTPLPTRSGRDTRASAVVDRIVRHDLSGNAAPTRGVNAFGSSPVRGTRENASPASRSPQPKMARNGKPLGEYERKVRQDPHGNGRSSEMAGMPPVAQAPPPSSQAPARTITINGHVYVLADDDNSTLAPTSTPAPVASPSPARTQTSNIPHRDRAGFGSKLTHSPVARKGPPNNNSPIE